MKVNIPTALVDPYYRYQRQQIKIVNEGSGNGVKTKLLNLQKVGKDLNRNTLHLLKYLSFSFCSPIIHDDKSKNYILKGKFSLKQIEDALEDFIAKYVLCEKCSNPETEFMISNKLLYLKCKSCGHQTDTSEQDKIVSFILREKELQKLNKKVQVKKISKLKEQDEEIVWSLNTSKEAIEQRRKEAFGL